MLPSSLSIDACHSRAFADAMASLWFVGADETLHAFGASRSGWSIICVVESRGINRCYVGRCGPLVISPSCLSWRAIRFSFASSIGRLSISLSRSSSFLLCPHSGCQRHPVRHLPMFPASPLAYHVRWMTTPGRERCHRCRRCDRRLKS